MKETQETTQVVDIVLEQLESHHGFEADATEEAVAACRNRFLEIEDTNPGAYDDPLVTIDSFMDALRDASLLSTFPKYDEVAFMCGVLQELSRQGMICIECSDAELRSTIEKNVAEAAVRREERIKQTEESLERLVAAGSVEVSIVDGVRRYRLTEGAASGSQQE